LGALRVAAKTPKPRDKEAWSMAKNAIRLNADKKILATGRSWEILALIAEFKSPATAKDSNGQTLAGYLWRREDLDCVALMEQAGIPLGQNAPFEAFPYAGEMENTSAHTVVERWKALEKRGVNLSARSTEGWSLIEIAAFAFHPVTMKFLESRGLDPLAAGVEGKSAFDRVLAQAVEEEQSAEDLTDFIEELAAIPQLGHLVGLREEIAWLERWTERGGKLPENLAGEVAKRTDLSGLAAFAASMRPDAGARKQSDFAARLEAAALRGVVKKANDGAQNAVEPSAKPKKKAPRV
jgi:hypothetical protein